MGLFDMVAGAVMDKVMGCDNGGMAQIAMQMFNEHGGLNGVLDKFKQGGLAELASSWVGEGANLPVSAEQITSVLGIGAIAEMAAKIGLTPEVLSDQIAQYLPNVIDKMTPDGEVTTDSGNLIGNILSMLK